MASDSAKAEAARVNRAWNVLSDPYQRGRYDEQLATARLDGDGDGDVGGNGEVETETRPARRRLFEPKPRAGQAARPAPERTIPVPAGMAVAPRRARVLAMVFDLTVIILIVLTCQFIGASVIEDQYPDQTARIEAIDKQIEDLDQEADDAGDRADQLEEDGDDTGAQAARDEQDAKRDEIEELENERTDLQGEMFGANVAVLLISVAIGLLYLVPSSAISGQTLGKRLRGVRAVRVDGSRLGWSAALVRYGVPALVTVMLTYIVGPLALVLTLFGVLAWMRNPNEQGLHDRLAKTIVVDASSPSAQ
jgi:curved DNA-binding protein CbpA